MYEAGIRYILGLNIEKNILKIEPHIPSNWKEYKIRYKYGNSIYNIKVINKEEKNKEIEKIIVDGKDTSQEEVYMENKKLEKNEILLNGSGGVYSVEVII